ncbi:MAG: glycosyltransferase family 4 protein [Bacteroidota bacterium]
MNILVLNYEYPPVGGGGGVISKYIAEGLAVHGHQITVVSVWHKGLAESEPGNPEIIRLRSKRKNLYRSGPLEMFSWMHHAKLFLKGESTKRKWDFCLANFTLPGGAVALHLKRKSGTPYAVISHGHDVPWARPRALWFFYILCFYSLKSILKKSGANFVQSEWMKQNIDRFSGHDPEKNILVTNGCNPAVFYPAEKPTDTFRIIFSGRLVRQKNPMSALKALRIIKDEGVEFSALFLGDGPLRKKMEAYICEAGLEREVELKGKIPQEEVAELYRSSSLMLAPSVSEGMSLTVLEALFGGLYVICTPVSGNPELVSEGINGEMIVSAEPRSIADAIIRFHREKFLPGYRIVPGFLEIFREKYSWKKIVDQYNNYLQSLK